MSVIESFGPQFGCVFGCVVKKLYYSWHLRCHTKWLSKLSIVFKTVYYFQWKSRMLSDQWMNRLDKCHHIHMLPWILPWKKVHDMSENIFLKYRAIVLFLLRKLSIHFSTLSYFWSKFIWENVLKAWMLSMEERAWQMPWMINHWFGKYIRIVNCQPNNQEKCISEKVGSVYG